MFQMQPMSPHTKSRKAQSMSHLQAAADGGSDDSTDMQDVIGAEEDDVRRASARNRQGRRKSTADPIHPTSTLDAQPCKNGSP